MPNQSRKLFALALQPGDPRRLLSSEARIRIDNTLNQQDALRRTAEVRALQLPPRAAARERSAARMEAAVLVLEAEMREFVAIGKAGTELRAIMDQEFEAAEGGLELTVEECNAVRSRLHAIRFALEEGLELTAPAPSEEPVPAKKQARREAHPNPEPIAPAPTEEIATPPTQRRARGRPINGARLKEYRESLGLSQNELAEKCGCSRATIDRAERGNPLDGVKRTAIIEGLSLLTEKEKSVLLAQLQYVAESSS
jgi:DNA-binding XRE family transcriptional regulator